MVQQSTPAAVRLTASNIAEFKSSNQVAFIGYIHVADANSNRIFSDAAERLRDEFVFGIINDPTVAHAEGVKQPGLVLYKHFDERVKDFEQELEINAISNFTKTYGVPLIGEINLETYTAYIKVSYQGGLET